MSGYLLDTNILSELRKRSRGDAQLLEWHASVPALARDAHFSRIPSLQVIDC